MNILPELNLNRHPKDCKDFSLVDAKHMIIDKDSYLLHTENSIQNYPGLDEKIAEAIGSNYNIVYAIPCNKEIVFFCLYKSNVIRLIRYNEDKDSIQNCNDVEYHNGEFTGTFTYNKNNLIISFSEFNDNEYIPLKVINLGQFGDINTNNENFYAICPKVKIPNCIKEYVNGNARKGWYYIFVRYKLINDNYTQWFNTGKSIFVDNYNEDKFQDYSLSKEWADAEYGPEAHQIVEVLISDDNDVANISFNLIFNNLDINYDHYQIGFINVRKDTTKCYRTDDIDIVNNQYTFNSNSIIEDSVINLITSYNNYYNVKTVDSYNNVLYIANYKEYNNIKNIDLSDINVSIYGYIKDNKDEIVKINETQIGTAVLSPGSIFNNIEQKINVEIHYDEKGEPYITADNFPWWVVRSDTYISYGVYIIANIGHNVTKLSKITKDSHLRFTIGGHAFDAYAKDIRCYIKLNTNNVCRYEFTTTDGQEFTYNCVNSNYTDNNIVLRLVNGANIGNVYNQYGHSYRDLYAAIPEKMTFYAEGVIELDTIDTETVNILNSNCVCPNEYYNIFVHFINQYGESSQGIHIGEFKDITINNNLTKVNNTIGNTLIYTKDNCTELKFKINKIPANYIGYFVSYEQFESHIKHKGWISESRFISNNINVKLAEKLDFNFDTLYIKKTNKSYNIVDKKLYIADTYNNISKPTNIELKITGNKNDIDVDTPIEAYLINTDIKSLYNKKNKTLVQCSKVTYDTNNFIDLEINNAFYSRIYYFKFSKNQKGIAHDGKIYETKYDILYFNNTIKAYQPENIWNVVYDVFLSSYYKDYVSIPNESYQFLNKPEVVFFPMTGINNTDVNQKSFNIGCHTEMKNTVDLFQQKNFAVYEYTPKTYINYDKYDTYINEFPKTIRRSNIIADESEHIGWRFFESDNYKNIIENKGNIIKLSSIGNIMLVHTEHSLFQFRADQALKSQEGNNIAVGTNDIWDLNYQEVFTSELGFAGINDLNHAIIGQFGYVFYEQDKGRFYRYDNQSIKQIDDRINNYVRRIKDKYKYLSIVDDADRDRLLINFYQDNIKETLSYNYKFNTFVSRHFYPYSFGYATKNKIYLLDNDKKNTIKTFSTTEYNDYTLNEANESYASIIVNTNYELNKVLEYIQYKINKIIDTDGILPKGKRNTYYSGELLQILSEECDTDEMNIYIDNPQNTINRVQDFTKPYRELGNWNFNYIRDISKFDNIPLPVKRSDDKPRFYGNWFIIKFIFTPNTIGTDCIELETLNYNYSKNLT